jgi:hypothetical protein
VGGRRGGSGEEDPRGSSGARGGVVGVLDGGLVGEH